MQMRRIWAMLGALVFATTAQANTPEPVVLEPIEHVQAELALVGPDGIMVVYTPESLEAFDTYRLRTMTPWRDVPADFDGVLLSDVLAESGLQELEEIRVVAENEYAVVIPRSVWETVPVLVATRVNGRAHTRRERGPIQLVIGTEDLNRSPVVSEAHMVWMAARIEFD